MPQKFTAFYPQNCGFDALESLGNGSNMQFLGFLKFWILAFSFILGIALSLWGISLYLVFGAAISLLAFVHWYSRSDYREYKLGLSFWLLIFFICICGYWYSGLFHAERIRYAQAQTTCDPSSTPCMLREYALRTLRYHLPAPASGLAAGILIGHTADLPFAIKNIFRELGLSHIVAVSGSNIVILTAIIMTLLSLFIPRRLCLILSIIVMLVYVLVVGFQTPVLRAALMALMATQAGLWGRKSHSLFALFLAALIMIVLNPRILKDDLGFQLSFAATAGLILLQPRIVAIIQRANIKIRNSIPEFLITSSATISAAQLATLPIIVVRFGIPSLLIFPANLVLAPMASFVMLLSLTTVLVSVVSPTLSNISGYATFLAATYIIQGAELLARIQL